MLGTANDASHQRPRLEKPPCDLELQRLTILSPAFHTDSSNMLEKDSICLHIPDAPCMEYLPTFTLNMAQMQVNIPYMEHLGIYVGKNHSKTKKRRPFLKNPPFKGHVFQSAVSGMSYVLKALWFLAFGFVFFIFNMFQPHKRVNLG